MLPSHSRVRWFGVTRSTSAMSAELVRQHSSAIRTRPRSAGGWGELLQAGKRSAYPLAHNYGGESVFYRTVVVGNAAPNACIYRRTRV